MSNAARLRDSTQIELPCGTLAELREPLEANFTVTVVTGESGCRIIGSPVEIKAASQFLGRHGVRLP
jgi:hypothetical protein